MFSNEGDEEMIDNVTGWALDEYQTFYNDDSITKEDIFYYTYGILHHLKYRKKYQNSLVRGLPHIPMSPDFWKFSDAGRKLAELHLGYETCQRYDLGKPLVTIPDNPTSIKFGTKPSDSNTGRKTVQDHSSLMMSGVKIYDSLPKVNYKVNGHTPVGWLTWTPKKSKADIDQDPFRVYTGKEMQAMIERLCHVGVESDRIIEELSKHEFETDDWKPRKTGLDAHIDENNTKPAPSQNC